MNMETNKELGDDDTELKSSYRILDARDVKSIQAKRIKEISEELGLSESLARGLLIKNGWHKQRAIDALMLDPDYIMKEFKIDLVVPNKVHDSKDEPFECPVCFCEAEPHEILTMEDCNHQFCIDCFQGYCLQQLE